MKLGIHSAPDFASTGSRSVRSGAPAADRVVDHQGDEPFDRVAWGVRRGQGCHGRAAYVVVHGADELVAIGEALVEVALGQARLPADGADGQRDRPHRPTSRRLRRSVHPP